MQIWESWRTSFGLISHILCSPNWDMIIIIILNTLEKHIHFTYQGQNPYCTFKLRCVYELKLTIG